MKIAQASRIIHKILERHRPIDIPPVKIITCKPNGKKKKKDKRWIKANRKRGLAIVMGSKRSRCKDRPDDEAESGLRKRGRDRKYSSPNGPLVLHDPNMEEETSCSLGDYHQWGEGV